MYDKLVAKANNVDTSRFVLKTKYDTYQLELKNKISNVNDFVKKAKLTELENKIHDISNLATKAALTTVENKMCDISNLVKKLTITQKLQKLKINLLTIITINILLLQNLIN